MFWGWDVDVSRSGPCPVTDFGVGGVENSDHTATVLVNCNIVISVVDVCKISCLGGRVSALTMWDLGAFSEQ
jgi:hypothetical protein